MVTQRKPASMYGPRIVTGRIAKGAEMALEFATRVKRIKKARGLTWPEFERVIGMTEKTRRERIRANPSPFTAEELVRIAVQFRIEPNYLLLGREPMLSEEVVLSETTGCANPLSTALHAEVVAHVCTQQDVEPQVAKRFLPTAVELLGCVERGIVKAWNQNLHTYAEKMSAISAAIRAEAGRVDAPESIHDDLIE